MVLACDVVAAALVACGCAGVLAGCDADAEAPAGVAAALAPAYPTHVRLSERQDSQPMRYAAVLPPFCEISETIRMESGI